MGCTQSNIVHYADISRDEAKLIPSVFRDISKQTSSPGLRYWFNTCRVKEGIIPMKIGNKEYNAEYTCISKDGYYPSDEFRPSQDSYSFMNSKFIINSNESSGIFMGVFDGHGDFGGECSSFCRDYMNDQMSIGATIPDSTSVASFISASLQDCNKIMHDKKYSGGLNDTNSGTTAVCLSIIDDEVICVNVGDSRCMAGYCTSDNQILPIPLSLDQTPFRDDERKRVEACGADVCTLSEKMPSKKNMNMDSMTFSPDNPPRIYLKNCGYPGAAFSRSVGDCIAESIGVIAEGEIMVKKIQNGVNHFIVASDGLWNFCIPEEIVCNIRFSTDLAKTGVSIVLSTFLRWIQLYGSSDDITLLLLRLPALDPDLNSNCKDWFTGEPAKEETIFD